MDAARVDTQPVEDTALQKHLFLDKVSRIVVKNGGSTEVNGNYTWLHKQERFLSDTGKFSILYEDTKWFLVCLSLDHYGRLYMAQSTSQMLPCLEWERCFFDEMPGLEPTPTIHEFRDDDVKLERSVPSHWQDVQRILVVVQKPDGASFEFEAVPDSSVCDVQERIQSSWGIIPYEQRLLNGANICLDSDRVWELMEQLTGDTCHTQLMLTCIRISPFHFHPDLAHPSLCVSEDRLTIAHGGQLEYQGAFASAVLESSAKLAVQLEVTGSGHCVSGSEAFFDGEVGFVDMFIGLVSDADRNWSMLECAGIGLEGIIYDGLFGSIPDGGCRDAPAVAAYFSRHGSKQRKLTLSVDLTSGHSCLLEFHTLEGQLLGRLEIEFCNSLGANPLRLCAIVGYPGQCVHIVS